MDHKGTFDQYETGENELLVVSFGTGRKNRREVSIGAVEAALEKAFPKWAVRRGFTSQTIIDHVKKNEGITIDHVTEALDRALKNKVKNLIVQPTYLMAGCEYEKLMQILTGYEDAFETMIVGKPLLASEHDIAVVEKAITDWTVEYNKDGTALVFMGHGTEHNANIVYDLFQAKLAADGFKNYFIGTVGGTPSLEDVLALAGAGDFKRIVLSPLMLAAGSHAEKDMAGEEKSWKKTFEDAGYEVVTLLRGLGENEAIQNLVIEHVKKAVE